MRMLQKRLSISMFESGFGVTHRYCSHQLPGYPRYVGVQAVSPLRSREAEVRSLKDSFSNIGCTYQPIISTGWIGGLETAQFSVKLLHYGALVASRLDRVDGQHFDAPA